MSGTLAIMHEDNMKAGYALLTGMTLAIAIMFRLKIRFSIKHSLLVTAIGLIICMHTDNIIVLVATCFISGIFKLWGNLYAVPLLTSWLLRLVIHL